jgi:hypothetical protein
MFDCRGLIMPSKYTCPHCETRQTIDPEVPIAEQRCEECGEWLAEREVDERPKRSQARPREDDEEWDDTESESKPRGVPGMVIAAGITWILFGTLSLLGSVFQVVVHLNAPPAHPMDEGAPLRTMGGIITGTFGGLIGGVFLFVGVQSIRGSARDVLGNAIGSLIFGLLLTLVGIFGVLSNAVGGKFVAFAYFFLALTLYAAGVLALVARPGYLAFRKSIQRKRRRR